MARSAKRPPPLTTFRHTVRVEVRRAEFEPLASVAHLDVVKLARATRAEVELGYFKTGCCRPFVRAIIQKGMVTDLVVEPCPDEKRVPPSPELVRLVNIARQRVTPRGSKPFGGPVPVADFMADAAAITIKTIVCVEVCIFASCFVCCTTPGGDVFCGARVIIHTP
jgi:hypothetical protein